jgi:hypothetical protein
VDNENEEAQETHRSHSGAEGGRTKPLLNRLKFSRH